MFQEPTGFLGSFLSKSLKTNQLEVNTDEKTLKTVARLKEPRDLFALPKDRDYDCPQQAARWPTECQVLDERIYHLEYVPEHPEPYYQPTGSEIRPRSVGEENGVVVYNYNPVSAVNYSDSDGSDSDSSSDSRSPTPDHKDELVHRNFSKRFSTCRSVSYSDKEDNDDDDEEDDDDDDKELKVEKAYLKTISPQRVPSPTPVLIPAQSLVENTDDNSCSGVTAESVENSKELSSIQNNNPPLQFSRSSVGGSKFLMNVHPCTGAGDYEDLEFESRFESGNLAKAVKITSTYYELYLRPDLYTNRHKQWFYFRVSNTRKHVLYRFSIVNLVKSDSLYNEGMRPLMYSTISAKVLSEGWKRCGENICYYRNEDESSSDEDEDNGSYTLTFNIQFPHDADTVYFAHSYPYNYTDLQDYLMDIQKHPVKSKFCKLRLLCRSLAGNNVYYLTVTAPTDNEETNKVRKKKTRRKKKAIVVSARVHPGETPSSWMMKGLMDFITGESNVAKRLRHKFIFKLIPMLNPDGVIVGNSRSSLTGKDLNRQYRTVIRETYPSIWYTKAMIKRLIDECGVAMYCDMHAHSRKHNVFIYGCENKRNPDKKLTEQVFPLMVHKNVADKFSFESCKFKVQRNKEGTGRIVIWMLGVTNSYTMEASFGGSTIGSRNGTHFNTADYESMGRAFCETLLDFCDNNPVKVKKRERFFKRIKRIRRRERREKKALKLKKLAEEEGACILGCPINCEKSEQLRNKIIERLLKEGSTADEPLNIPLTDYSSDEGDTSSGSSDNEGKAAKFSDLEGPCCQPLKVPPCSPVFNLVKLLKDERKRIMLLKRKRRSKKRKRVLPPYSDYGDYGDFTPSKYFKHRKKKKGPKLRHWEQNCTTKESKLKRQKKTKLKCKSSSTHKRNKIQRTPLDLPTTDPGSDIQFSTDDELYIDGYGTIPRTRRTLIQSELQRKYMAETCNQQMPPELIVTPAKNSLIEESKSDKEKKLPSPTTTEFPPIGMVARRTNSWHNLNKSAPKLRVQNLNHLQAIENDALQFKLNLKKQFWTGVMPEVGPGGDRSRPLSWGMPPIIKQKSVQIKDEHEALFAACCVKLTEWQELEMETNLQHLKNKVTINLITPVFSEKKAPRPKKASNPKSIPKPIESLETKSRKKRNPLTKIAETTQILTRLAKSKNRSSFPGRKSSKPLISCPTTSGNSLIPVLTPLPRNHKFKTSGIVATAVQPLKKKKSRSIPLLKENANESDVDLEKSYVKKVKSRSKKKKKSSC